VACVVALVIGVVSLVQLSHLQQRTTDVQVQGLVPTTQMASIRRAFLQTRIDALADELIPGTSDNGPEHKAFLADVDTMNAAVATFANGSYVTAAQAADVAALRAAWGTYQAGRAHALGFIRLGQVAQYMKTRNLESKPAAAALNAALSKLEVSAAAQATATVSDAQSTYRSARALLLIVLVLGLVLSVLLGAFVARLIIRPVTAVRDGLVAMASGDLTVQVAVTSTDEVGQMAGALNQADRRSPRPGSRRRLWPRPQSGSPVPRSPSPPARRRPPHRPAPWPAPPSRSRGMCRLSPPAPRRWARRSTRSPRTRRKPPGLPAPPSRQRSPRPER
jgi:methyl-accepting chemotaxis protein